MEREDIEKEIEQKVYIEALEGTIKDLKMALNTILMLDDIEQAHEVAHLMLNDFYSSDEFIKITTLQKEAELLKRNGIIDDEGKLIKKESVYDPDGWNEVYTDK